MIAQVLLNLLQIKFLTCADSNCVIFSTHRTFSILHVKPWIIVFGTECQDVREPITIVEFGRSLTGIGEGPGLPLISPVVRLQSVSIAEPGHCILSVAQAVEILAYLKACRCLSYLRRAWMRTADDFTGRERVAAGRAVGNPIPQRGHIEFWLDANLLDRVRYFFSTPALRRF